MDEGSGSDGDPWCDDEDEDYEMIVRERELKSLEAQHENVSNLLHGYRCQPTFYVRRGIVREGRRARMQRHKKVSKKHGTSFGLWGNGLGA